MTAAVLPVSARASATALPLMRVELPKVKPADADAKRRPIQDRARALVEAGDPGAAGIEYDNAAAQWGDPVLYMDAGDAYVAAAEADRDVEMAQAAIERARIALDILYFHLDSAADEDFQLVSTSDVPGMIARSNELIDQAETLIEEIEREAELAAAPAPAAKKTSSHPGRIKIVSGAALTVVGGGLLAMGFAGLGLGFARQNEAEDPAVYGEEYDDVESKGKQANVLAGVGLAAGAVAAGAGVVLIMLGRKANKKKKSADDKVVRVAPLLGSRFGSRVGGVTLSGRF